MPHCPYPSACPHAATAIHPNPCATGVLSADGANQWATGRGTPPSADELDRWLAEQWRLVELRLLTPEQAMQDVRFLQQVLPDQHARLMAHQARLGH